MAVTLKRRRGAVSYKEPSSDENESGSSDEEEPRRPTRPAPARRSNRQHAPSSTQTSPAIDNHIATQSRTSNRHHKQRASYKDVSTDEDEEDPDADFQMSDTEAPTPSQPFRVKVASPRKPRTSKGKSKSWRKLVLGASLKPNKPAHETTTSAPIPSDRHIPAWASLPYHVLLQVFVYASHPLRDENIRPTASISWLVQAARMCSAFTKPALTALYRNPPIFAMRQTRKDLVHHLISPPSDAHEDPRVMVKRLELDATQMTGLTDHVNSVTDLAALVRSLTTLREIDIFDPLDRPPFRERMRRIRRWIYPVELFDALRQSDLHLHSWRWNSTFCDQGPLWIKSLHGEPVFQSLREVTLQKFHPAEILKQDQEHNPDQPTVEELVASALAALPDLKSLSFETCGIVSGRFLPLLPTNLVSLSITNCGELLSDAMQAFLATHGAQLKDLTLNYNQSLHLSFLVDLKQSCPKLETLRMDMTYYSSLNMSSDNDPLYEMLLGEDELPTWPTMLRVIDLQFLRKWNLISATNFLSSLVEAAGDLPWLRELTIISSVDADWRQRADFRQKWTARFKTVFARAWKAPSPHLVSLKAYRDWMARSHSERGSHTVIADEQGDSLIEGVSETAVAATKEDSDSDAPLLSSKRDEQWGSKRLRNRSKATASYDEGSEDEDELDSKNAVDDEVVTVQGRCHTVLFRIDNIRPQEEHFTEADFLDAEPSDDEEWNGNDDNNDEGGYAW